MLIFWCILFPLCPSLSFLKMWERWSLSIIFAPCTFGLTLAKCRQTPEYYCLGSNASFLTIHVTLDKLVIFSTHDFLIPKMGAMKGLFPTGLLWRWKELMCVKPLTPFLAFRKYSINVSNDYFPCIIASFCISYMST